MRLRTLDLWLEQQMSRLIKNDLVRRMIKNSGYLFSTTGVAAAISMVQGILTARLLGAAGFGILGTITLFTNVINNLVSFRMGELVVKYVGEFSEHDEPSSAAAVFKLSAIFEMTASLFAFGLILILAPVGAKYFVKDPAAAPMFVLYGLVVLVNLISETSIGLMQIYDRFRRLAGLGIFQSLVTLALIVLANISHSGLTGILIAYLAGKAVGAITISTAAVIEAARRWGVGWWRTPIRTIQKSWGEMARFAISTNISSSISLLTKDSELLWVSLLRGPTEAGYYKLALALSNMVQMPVEPLPQATYPELSRLAARREWGSVRYLLHQGSRLAGAYTLLVGVILIVFGKPIIRLLYSTEFLPSYPALLILLTGLLVANTFYWRRVALLALGRADFPAKLNGALAIIKIGATLALVPRLGYLMSAALLSGFYWIGSLVSAVKIRALITQRDLSPESPV